MRIRFKNYIELIELELFLKGDRGLVLAQKFCILLRSGGFLGKTKKC